MKVSLQEAVGKGYKDFWNFTGRYRVCKGSRASKKSKTTALNFIYRIMKYPQANLLVVRKVFGTLKDSCYTELKWAIHRFGVDSLFDCKMSPLEITYKPTGQKIYFRGLDDPLKVTSITVDVGYLCWLWIEEAYEITSEDDFNMLDESIRGEVGDNLFKQATLTFNPWSDRHWLKRRFFDVSSEDVLAITTNYMCNEWLDNADKRLFENMKKNNPKRYAVAGLGEWGVTEGVIFENWRTEDLTELIPTFDNIYCGMDFGYSNDPNALIKVHISKAQRKIYVFAEWYQAGMSDEELSEVAREFVGNDYITCDSAEPKTIDFLASKGVKAVPAMKGADSINRGIRWLQGYEIVVHKNCQNFINEISQSCWLKDKYGNAMAKPVDKDNHLLDALRYATEQLQLESRVTASIRL